MNWTIPGTTLEGLRSNADHVEELFQPMFLSGGLTLSQVSHITGLENHTIQNWVKRGFLPPPQNKRYNMEQLCRIININLLKGNMPLEQIVKLMAYLNGDLADESDDLVDDTMLYFMFVSLAARARHLGGNQTWDEALEQITAGYVEPVAGAREKLCKVLKIMLTTWIANLVKAAADRMMEEYKEEMLCLVCLISFFPSCSLRCLAWQSE